MKLKLLPLKVTLSVLLVSLLLLGGMWLWVVTARDILQHPLHNFPWPIACSTRGCITSQAWKQHHVTRITFATITKQSLPTPAESLTTLLRQHLVTYAFVRPPVTGADARRYREEILNAKSTDRIHNATGQSLEEYDRNVVLPFLLQEALRQQRQAESAEELFAQLAQERRIIVFPRNMYWDRANGRVATK